jgi:hypothetical protein
MDDQTTAIDAMLDAYGQGQMRGVAAGHRFPIGYTPIPA